MASEVETVQVDIGLGVPGLFWHGSRASRFRATHIVHQNIDAVVFLNTLIDQRLDWVWASDPVSTISQKPPSFSRRSLVRLADESERLPPKMKTLASKMHSNSRANSPALVSRLPEAGDRNNLSLKAQHGGNSSNDNLCSNHWVGL